MVDEDDAAKNFLPSAIKQSAESDEDVDFYDPQTHAIIRNKLSEDYDKH